jgi:hypothetical protein
MRKGQRVEEATLLWLHLRGGQPSLSLSAQVGRPLHGQQGLLACLRALRGPDRQGWASRWLEHWLLCAQ